MRMTPLDVQSHRFGRRWNGYDRSEVESFLRLVAEDYESLLRENEELRSGQKRLHARIEELVADERALKETLVNAQAMSEEIRQVAARESEVLLSEAELRAERIIDAAHRRAARLAQDIREMRGLRTRLAAALRAALTPHLHLIDALETDAEEDPVGDAFQAALAPGELSDDEDLPEAILAEPEASAPR